MPIAGIGLFVLLYFIASSLYPGGSNFDRAAVGFSWQSNYWCDLLSHTAKNGEINSAQPVAMTAMGILSASLSVFWYNLPLLFPKSNHYALAGRWAGIISMVLVCFVYTSYHDVIINVAGGFGLIALLTTFASLYRSRLYEMLWLGLFCLLLMVLNQYIYQSGHHLVYLAVVQKVSFATFLTWICLVILLRPSTPATDSTENGNWA